MFVPKFKIPAVEAKVAKLNKRAVKLGLELIKLEISDPIFKEFNVYNTESKSYAKYVIEVVDVMVDTPAIKLDGWEFKASIKYADGVALVNGNVGKDENYHDIDPTRCDHCNVKRNRVKLVVVAKDNEEKVVGLSCMKDFLGHDSLSSAESAWNYVSEIENVSDGWDDFGYLGESKAPLNVNLRDFVSVTAGIIKAGEWVSRSDAEKSYTAPSIATADEVFGILKNRHNPKNADLIEEFSVSDEELDKIFNHVNNPIVVDNFSRNAKALYSLDGVSEKYIGYVAGAAKWYFSYLAKLERDTNKLLLDNSKYVGEVKKRDDFNLTIIGVNGFETQYGYTYIIRFKDENNNVINWFSSRSPRSLEIEEGRSYVIKATVKNHEAYNDVKTTYITRAKVLSEIS